mmetsp:Transcript_20333/g.49132  ORF Transcript_20333/g.49132 Transcript_20333/m.49132 type:complete len:252 (+) Transcript_20333:170-925(+)
MHSATNFGRPPTMRQATASSLLSLPSFSPASHPPTACSHVGGAGGAGAPLPRRVLRPLAWGGGGPRGPPREARSGVSHLELVELLLLDLSALVRVDLPEDALGDLGREALLGEADCRLRLADLAVLVPRVAFLNSRLPSGLVGALLKDLFVIRSLELSLIHLAALVRVDLVEDALRDKLRQAPHDEAGHSLVLAELAVLLPSVAPANSLLPRGRCRRCRRSLAEARLETLGLGGGGAPGAPPRSTIRRQPS